MDILSATGVAGLISLLSKVLELATGTKKNREEIKALSKDLEEATDKIVQLAFQVERLSDKLKQSEENAQHDRREFLTAIKGALIEHGVDHKRVAELEEMGKKKEDA